MSDETNVTELERRARRAFEESVASLDGATRSRLAQARANALAGGIRRARPGWLGALRPLPVGVAAAAMLVALVWLGRPDGPETMDSAALVDLDILLGEDELELLEELEFYAWLEDQPEILELADEDDIG